MGIFILYTFIVIIFGLICRKNIKYNKIENRENINYINKSTHKLYFVICGLILFLIAALLVFSLIALYSAKLGKIINKSDKSQKILNKLVSLVFVALAIKLISTKQ